MNKKTILILLVIIVTILTSITVFANTNIKVAVEKVLSKEEFNEQRKKDKENWINSNHSDVLTYSSTEENIEEDKELINKYTTKEEEVNQTGNTIDEIVNRFYRKEYESLIKKIEENADKMSLNELYMQPYAESLFDLIIDIIKNKDITNTERDILKGFLSEQYAFIKQNSTMKLKFDEILK